MGHRRRGRIAQKMLSAPCSSVRVASAVGRAVVESKAPSGLRSAPSATYNPRRHRRRGPRGDVFTYYAEHIGDMFGMPGNSRSFKEPIVHILRFRAGKVCEHWRVENELGMVK